MTPKKEKKITLAKKYTFFLQYAHNSKEKKEHGGAKGGGFFVGKEIPDSDSSEEGATDQ